MEREKSIEQYLKKRVEDAGGLCLKFVSPGESGVPDRIVILGGETRFVEMKSPRGGLSPRQRYEIDRIRGAGGAVAVIKNRSGVDGFVAALAEGRREG
jgi:hypothetical protein